MTPRDRRIFFISGDIFKIVTGGSLCDRMIVEELEKTYSVEVVIPHSSALARLDRPLLTGLINNVRNLFRRFPRHSLLFIDHGVYRDCFLAANLWQWLYSCRVVGLVYHLEYKLPEVHGGRALRKLIERMMIRVYAFTLTISQSTADHLQALGVRADRIAQVPVSRRFGPQEFIARNGNDSVVTFLFVGSIEPRKGLLDAINALGAYGGEKRINFQCVGNCDRTNAYFREVTSAAKNFPHLTVTLPGAVGHEELIRYFRGADAFLFPSHWEGYGIAIEEAMCFGLPVIAYDAGAVPELVEDGATGWLAPAGDIRALSNALSECIENPAERQRRGRRGLTKAEHTTRAHHLPEILASAIAEACR